MSLLTVHHIGYLVKKIEKAKKMLKADKKYAFEVEVLEKIKKVLEERKIS